MMKTNSSTDRLDEEAAEQAEITERAEAQSSQDINADLDEENTSDAESLTEDERPDAGVPPSSLGSQAHRVKPEDEANAAEEEIEEGIAEADSDTRAKSTHHS